MLNRMFAFLVMMSITIISYSSLYYITETECAVKVRVNHLLVDDKKNSVQQPGLYFKVPFRDSLVRWDSRIQHTTLRSMPIITLEEIALHLDYQFSWRIIEPMRYVEHMVKSPFGPKQLFLRWLNEGLEANWQQKALADLIDNQFENLKEELKIHAQKIGIEVIDCKVIQKAPSPQSKKNILARMKKNQTETIDATVKNAKIQAALIESQAKINQQKLIFEAEEQTEAIKKEGEIEAMQLYTEIYVKNQKFAKVYQQTMSEISSLKPKNSKLVVVQINSPLSEST